MLKIFTVIGLVLLTVKASAHPHSWIDVQTELTLNEKGQLIELQQQWEFDVYYSKIRLADINKEFADQQEGLRYAAKEMAKNLAYYHYFSELIIDQQAVTLPSPKTYSLVETFNEGQQQLTLTLGFIVDDQPLVKNKNISWRVFDPTYFIDMKHHSAANIIIKNNSVCTTTLELPTPSQELINYAIALDREETGTPNLGSHFAEKILIRC